jgi:hypothetical protein
MNASGLGWGHGRRVWREIRRSPALEANPDISAAALISRDHAGSLPVIAAPTTDNSGRTEVYSRFFSILLAQVCYRLVECSVGKDRVMREIKAEAFEFLIARAGLDLNEEQKAELKSVYAGIAAMAERVRKPRGHMAEPAHVYDFTEEDLA